MSSEVLTNRYSRRALTSLSSPAAVLIIWALAILAVHAWGRLVNESSVTKVAAPPLFGRPDLRVTFALSAALLVTAVVVAIAPRLVRTLGWKRLLVATWVGSLLWCVTLAAAGGGLHVLAEPLNDPADYLANLRFLSGPADVLQAYAGDLAQLSVHAEGHPPGPLLFFWALGWMGLQGPGWAAAAVIVAGTSSAIAVLVTVKIVAGETNARRCAPWLVLVPAAVWIATSADALFMAIAAWAVAAMAAATARSDGFSRLLALGSGLLFGAALFMSYGLGLVGVLLVAVAVAARQPRLLVTAAIGAVLVATSFLLAGFWWFDGLAATLVRYRAGVSADRPYAYFVVANLAALAIVVGPAAIVGMVRLRDGRLWLLCGAALAAVLVADLSGLSKGEVERIWLPFAPWLLVGAASIPERQTRWLLSLQAAVALAVQAGIRTPW